MSSPHLSTIAQLLFADPAKVDFARIVSELNKVLTRLPEPVVMTWDCDDLVTFDKAGTRILLGWSEGPIFGYGGCLSVAVGPADEDATPNTMPHETLCSHLVERIRGRFTANAILWCQAHGVIDAEVLDELAVALPDMAGNLPSVDSILDMVSRSDLTRATAQMPARRIRSLALSMPALIAANDQPDLPRPSDIDLARLRLALYPPDPEAPAYTTQMRLAVHCMNATLILVWIPLGAAVMTYALLRGEDMRLSGRLMAVTGTMLALAQTPMGQTMAAMARTLG